MTYFRKVVILLLFQFLLFPTQINAIFCSSYCSSSTSSCTGITKADCSTCASSIYNPIPNPTTYPTDPCRLTTQVQQIARQLNNTSMNISNFITSNDTTHSCNIYQISGQYIDKDYITRNFTQLSLNHYEIVVRFSIGYIGTWSATQNMNLLVEHQYGQNNNTWAYACSGATEFLCSGTGLDCFETKEFTLLHNNSFLLLNFTSLYNQSDPADQYWGIKDLIVVSKMCHSNCATCYGPASNQCTSCANGFYLNGNVCVALCPVLYIPSLKVCTNVCPAKYYLNTINNYCEQCMANCLYCSNSAICITWQTENSNPQNLWHDYLGVWVALICGGSILIIILMWKVIQFLLAPKHEYVKQERVSVSQQLTLPNDDEVVRQNFKQRLHNSNEIDLQNYKKNYNKNYIKGKQVIQSFGQY